ncbi:MAG: amidinotransferase, partial [Flavobacteriales bacterium]|nr:amidinotransferase [Flavobacteriales bacterium]
MIKLNLHNETSPLEAVLLGLPDSFGGTPKLARCYDPKSREHVLNGTFPTQQNVINEMNAVKSVFLNYGIEVFRPRNIEGLNQIFSRDIGFVIDNKFIVPNIIDDRKEEVKAIDTLLENIRAEDIISMPSDARVEGGDVMLCDGFIFVGYSKEADFHKYQVARTNRSAV